MIGATAVSSNMIVLQVFAAVVGGVVLTAVLTLWRRGRRFLIHAEVVVETIAKFGDQWSAASLLSDKIAVTAAEVSALKDQMGTSGRHPEWVAIESYLHDWRHDQGNAKAELRMMVEALQKVSGQMTNVAKQMVEVADRIGAPK